MIGSTAVADETRDVDLAVVDPPLQLVVGAGPREAVIAIVDPPLHLVRCEDLLLGPPRRLCVQLLDGRSNSPSRNNTQLCVGSRLTAWDGGWSATLLAGVWLVVSEIAIVDFERLVRRETCLGLTECAGF